MKGDRVEAVVDTGQGTRRSRSLRPAPGVGSRVTTARGVVEVTEVTRSGTPVRTGRFMASRLVALVEHPGSRAMERESTSRRAVGWVPTPAAAVAGAASPPPTGRAL